MSTPVPSATPAAPKPAASKPAASKPYLDSDVAKAAWLIAPLALGPGWAFLTFAYVAHRRDSGLLWLSALAYGVMSTTYVHGSVLFDPALRPFDWLRVLVTVHAALFVRDLVRERRAGTPGLAPVDAQERALSGWYETLRLRRVARELAERNPQLALDLRVGRADLPAGDRTYPDGGLVDVNNVSAAVLADVLGLSPAEAEKLTRIRWDVGGVADIDDVSILLAIPPQRLDPVARRLVFLPLLPGPRPT